MNPTATFTCDISDAEKGIARSPQNSFEANIDVNSRSTTLALKEADLCDTQKHQAGNSVTKTKSRAVEAEREITETKTIPCMYKLV